MTYPEPTELIEFLAPYPAEVQELTLAGREFLLEMLYPVSEMFFDATYAVCSAFTYTGDQKGAFVNFAVYPKHVTLIFPWGAHLHDPERRLGGQGNRVRHIRLSSLETLQDDYVLDLIKQASHNAPRPKGPIEPHRVVKIYKGAKRRPSVS
jgi:hypothetical protein